MPRTEWSAAETVVLIYFASRGVHHKGALSSLILRKCGTERGEGAIRGRIATIHRDQTRTGRPKLLHSGEREWNIHVVDGWLSRQGVTDLQALTYFGDDEVADVTQVDLSTRDKVPH